MRHLEEITHTYTRQFDVNLDFSFLFKLVCLLIGDHKIVHSPIHTHTHMKKKIMNTTFVLKVNEV